MESLNAMSARSLQYYVITRHWVSDLDFFRVETVFFNHLVNDHFLNIAAYSGVEGLHQILIKIKTLEQNEAATNKLLTAQLKQLELMTEDLIPENPQELTAKQVRLEYMVTNLSHEFRKIKKELFSLLEMVIKQEKRIMN